MSLSDQEVFMRWAGRRDAEAYSELVRRYAGIVYGVCRRVLRNDSDAEEVTQDCFAQLVLFSGKSPIHPAAWLHGMATHKSLMRLRAEERRRRREQEYAVLRANAHEVTWNDIAGFVDAAVQELPEAVRAPVVMHFLGGKTHAAIAEEMGIPRRTVSNRIERGIELLGESLRHRGLTLTGASLGVFLFTHLSEAETLPETVTAALEKLALAHASGSPLAVSGLLGRLWGAKSLAAALLAMISLAVIIAVGNFSYAPKAAETASKQAVSQAEGETTEGETMPSSVSETLVPSIGSLFQGSATISGKVLDKTITCRPEQLAAIQFSSKEDWENNKKVGEAMVLMKVFEEASKPLSGVLVVAQGGGILRTAKSDEQGHYQIDNLKPGSYGVYAERPSGAIIGGDRSVQSQNVSVNAGENKKDVDFSFRFNGLVLTGHVKDTAGKPIEGAIVEVNCQPEWKGESNTRNMEPLLGIADSQGVFQFSGLAPMDILNACNYIYSGPNREGIDVRFALTARAKGYGSAKIIVPAISETLVRQADTWMSEMVKMRERAGEGSPEKPVERSPNVYLPPSTGNTITDIDFVLDAGAVVSGQLIDTQGMPVAEKDLSMNFEQPQDETPRAVKGFPVSPNGVTTDAEGRFSFADVTPQTYVFNVSRQFDYQKTRNEPLQVNAGDRIENLQLVVESLEERGQISGMFVDAITGRPVQNALLEVDKIESPTEKNPVTGEKEIDAEKGTFSIKNITAGTAILKAWAESYPVIDTSVEIARGVNPPISIKLLPEGIIEGVISVNGEATQGRVSARRVDGQEVAKEYGGTQLIIGEQTDPSGNYSIRKLPAGQYHVQMYAAPYDDENLHVSSLGQVAVAAGQIARLDLNVVAGTASIHGVFIPSEAHQKGSISLFTGEWTGYDKENPEDDLQHWLAFRANRRDIYDRVEFEFPQLPAGTYTLHAVCYNRKDDQEEQENEQPQLWRVLKVEEGAELDVILNFSSSEFE